MHSAKIVSCANARIHVRSVGGGAREARGVYTCANEHPVQHGVWHAVDRKADGAFCVLEHVRVGARCSTGATFERGSIVVEPPAGANTPSTWC